MLQKFESSFPIFRIPRDHSALWKVPRAPESLFAQGHESSLRLLEKLPERGLAIVGSRECQGRSRAVIREGLHDLRGFNGVILSGLARGIDAEAHESALRERLPTIAILGCGLNVSYPTENDSLRRAILEAGGLVISEFEADAPPISHHFLQRNRLIAGWAQAIWVVEAGARSGAINTATWAKAMERTCYVTPCFPGDSTLQGNQRLLESRRVNEGTVRPYWGARSLGETWLEIESMLSQARSQTRAVGKGRKTVSNLIVDKISQCTIASGGVTYERLLRWKKEEEIPAEIFFLSLQEALESGSVVVRKGVITADFSRA